MSVYTSPIESCTRALQGLHRKIQKQGEKPGTSWDSQHVKSMQAALEELAGETEGLHGSLGEILLSRQATAQRAIEAGKKTQRLLEAEDRRQASADKKRSRERSGDQGPREGR